MASYEAISIGHRSQYSNKVVVKMLDFNCHGTFFNGRSIFDSFVAYLSDQYASIWVALAYWSPILNKNIWNSSQMSGILCFLNKQKTIPFDRQHHFVSTFHGFKKKNKKWLSFRWKRINLRLICLAINCPWFFNIHFKMIPSNVCNSTVST